MQCITPDSLFATNLQKDSICISLDLLRNNFSLRNCLNLGEKDEERESVTDVTLTSYEFFIAKFERLQ